MGVFSDFSRWVSDEANAIGHGASSFATGVVNTAKYGLKTVVHTPVAIVHEISSGVVKVSQAGANAFTGAAHEGAVAFGSGATAFVAASGQASQALVGVSKNVGSLGSSLGSSFAWPLAIVAGVVAFAIIKR